MILTHSTISVLYPATICATSIIHSEQLINKDCYFHIHIKFMRCIQVVEYFGNTGGRLSGSRRISLGPSLACSTHGVNVVVEHGILSQLIQLDKVNIAFYALIRRRRPSMPRDGFGKGNQMIRSSIGTRSYWGGWIMGNNLARRGGIVTRHE
jgi:hypothetical protein